MEKGLMPSTREVRTEKVCFPITLILPMIFRTCNNIYYTQNDTDTLLKCMTMVTELMLQAPFKKMFPTLHTLMDTLVRIIYFLIN